MQVLTVDVGTGTQDIYLYRSGLSLENGFKLVVPSPTMRIRDEILDVTRHQDELLLHGVMMGGGPCHWAAEAHIKAGYKLFATPAAARTFNDDLDWVSKEMGVTLVSEDEAQSMKNVSEIELRDFDFGAIEEAFLAFGLKLEPAALAIAVFDHGNAPPEISDRQFRFDYLKDQIHRSKKLSTFAFLPHDVPPSMTRLQAVVDTAAPLGIPLLVMDTAPAAVAGAMLDPYAMNYEHLLVVNIGNFHTIAFRQGPGGIEGVFEHHTGLIDQQKLEHLLEEFAAGTLEHADVFNHHGHGAILFNNTPISFDQPTTGLTITGPRRSMMHASSLDIHYAVPVGDMMIAGCFGLLQATGEKIPALRDAISSSLLGIGSDVAPWDAAS
jgi:uncharacterized protein (DUF1786 family)